MPGRRRGHIGIIQQQGVLFAIAFPLLSLHHTAWLSSGEAASAVHRRLAQLLLLGVRHFVPLYRLRRLELRGGLAVAPCGVYDYQLHRLLLIDFVCLQQAEVIQLVQVQDQLRDCWQLLFLEGSYVD